jgi:Holliday junction resolvase
MRTAAKVDRNQAEVVNALRKVGASVQSLASIGKGCPDLLVGYHGILYLMEVKDGSNVPSKQLLTEDQKKWHDAWTGSPVHVVRSIEQALKILGER